MCELKDFETGDVLQIETQVYVSKILYDYVKLLEGFITTSG